MKREKFQGGFTLVELAIVLVIIGIILGAVLKGQELINNAKIKRLYNQYREVMAALYTYYDKYGYFPGDDPTASSRWGASVTNGNGNGLIAVAAGSTIPNFACTATGSEQCDLWAELRLANIISGSGFTNPTNPYGGGVAVSYYTMPAVGAGSTALTAHWIHFQNVPYDVCQSIDRVYDDGNAGTGSIRGPADYMTATSGVYQLSFKF